MREQGTLALHSCFASVSPRVICFGKILFRCCADTFSFWEHWAGGFLAFHENELSSRKTQNNTSCTSRCCAVLPRSCCEETQSCAASEALWGEHQQSLGAAVMMFASGSRNLCRCRGRCCCVFVLGQGSRDLIRVRCTKSEREEAVSCPNLCLSCTVGRQ